MKNLTYLLFVFALAACGGTEKPETTEIIDPNPAAVGFDMEGSDSTAIAIADLVMEAMGGRARWDSTRFINWTFFGRRELTWDKQTGRVRIESPGDTMTYLVNIFHKEGKAFKDGRELTDSLDISEAIERAYRIWVNDSYWLVMPFKLKDSGVTLTHVGTDTTREGVFSDLLQLTFEEVGVTPQNKYRVWVDTSDHLVKQWAFYAQAVQDTPSAVWPWDNYKEYNGLLISADRSDGRGPGNVKISTDLPDSIFEAY